MSHWFAAYKKQPLVVVFGGLMLVFLLVSRFVFLTSVPTSLSHDEMVYALNAQSVAQTGTDITGQWRPWSLSPVHQDFAELPTVFMAPFFWLPVSPFLAAKLPFVLMSLVLPCILGGLAKRVSGSTAVGVATGALAIFNPWLWQTGRLAFDGMFSFFFFLSAAWAYTSLAGWKKLWAFPLFFLGFYQYQGYKLLFLPWVAGLFSFLVYEAWQKLPEKKRHWTFLRKQELWPALSVVGLSILLFTFYLVFQLPGQTSQERVQAMITPNSEVIREATNGERRVSLETSWNRFFVNEYVVWGEYLLHRLVAVYSPTYWFSQGQANVSAFSVWSYGSFYVLDIVFLLVGVVALARRQRWLLVGLAGGFLWAPLPALLASQEWFYFRASLVIPLFLLVMGVGLAEIATKWSRWARGLLAVGYILLILQFSYQFFVRYPVYSSARHYFVDKVVSEYISRLPEGQSVVILTPEPEFTFKSLVFYQDWLGQGQALQIQQAFRDQQFQYGSVKLTKECYRPNDLLSTDTTWIVRADAPVCEDAVDQDRSPDHLSFSAVEDSGEVYFIYNDQLCEQTEMSTYLRVTKLQQFELNSLSLVEFCRSWVTDLRPLRQSADK